MWSKFFAPKNFGRRNITLIFIIIVIVAISFLNSCDEIEIKVEIDPALEDEVKKSIEDFFSGIFSNSDDNSENDNIEFEDDTEESKSINEAGTEWTEESKSINEVGIEWTEEDQIQYDRLNSKKAKAFKKKVTNSKKDYKKAEEKDDLFEMNKARYEAVKARQDVYDYEYKDTYDYTYGENFLVFLGVHRVPPWLGGAPRHACIVIMVSSDFNFGNEPFINSEYSGYFENPEYGGKVSYATIGAGEKDNKIYGFLRSNINREPNDIDLSIKKEMMNLNISDPITINNLFIFESRYSKNVTTEPYKMIPFKSDSHNSNSFTHGLLDVANVAHTKPKWNLPGWDQPIPPEMFKEVEP